MTRPPNEWNATIATRGTDGAPVCLQYGGVCVIARYESTKESGKPRIDVHRMLDMSPQDQRAIWDALQPVPVGRDLLSAAIDSLVSELTGEAT